MYQYLNRLFSDFFFLSFSFLNMCGFFTTTAYLSKATHHWENIKSVKKKLFIWYYLLQCILQVFIVIKIFSMLAWVHMIYTFCRAEHKLFAYILHPVQNEPFKTHFICLMHVNLRVCIYTNKRKKLCVCLLSTVCVR